MNTITAKGNMPPNNEKGNFHECFDLVFERQIIDTLDVVRETLAKSGISLLTRDDKTKQKEQQIRDNPSSSVNDDLELQLFYCLGIGDKPTPVTVTVYVFGNFCSIGVSVSHDLEHSFSHELDLLRTNIDYAIQEGQKISPVERPQNF